MATNLSDTELAAKGFESEARLETDAILQDLLKHRNEIQAFIRCAIRVSILTRTMEEYRDKDDGVPLKDLVIKAGDELLEKIKQGGGYAIFQ
jgi:hypothetical protein